MGLLAESKIRRKINKDPNNTKWTRDTNTFGQKILRAQGWEPGQFLGVKDAPHSELHTAANASYIRVVLKDDMKGLGFQRAKEDEVTGLDVFQDLLSRLNGKSNDSIEEDQQARLAIKIHHFVEQRYGPMRFVRGGLLVGDELKEIKDDDDSREGASGPDSNEDEVEAMEVDPAPTKPKTKKSKKRKAMDDEDASESESKSKRRRKEERKREKRAKKEKSRSKKDAEKIGTEESEDDSAPSDDQQEKRKSKKDKSRSLEESGEDKVKESKKSKKDKKEKKEKKRRKKEDAENSGSEATSLEQASATPSVVASGTSTPTGTGTGTSTPRGSRNFVRSRFIAQKRQAVMDSKALAQIFMVKA